jgi:hypothetical protein
MISVNFKHLQQAKQYAGSTANGLKLYWWHLKLSFSEAAYLFIWALGSIIHGLFPFLIDFDLLSARVNRLRALKTKLPNDPILSKIEFKE